VTMVSMPYQGVMGALGFFNWNLLQQVVVNASKVGVPFSAMQFKTDTVQNIVFGSYNDTMLWQMAQYHWPVPPSVPLQANQTFANCADAHAQQADAFYQFFTGSNDTSLVHEYVAWNGVSWIGVWNSTEANTVSGSDAIMFGPNLNTSIPQQIFVDSLGRGGDVLYNQSVELYGITVAQYLLDPALLLNGSNNPTNYGYFAGGGPGAPPLPNGVMNESASQANVEVYISKPHFLDADPYYLSLVQGVSLPNRSIHDTFLDVEPITGVTLGTWKRTQINTYVRPLQLQGYPNITAQYFPVLWLEEGGMITPSLASNFKSAMYTAVRIRKYGPVAAFILAGLLAGLSLVLAGVGLGVIGNAHRRDGYEEVSQANYDS